MVRPEDVMPLTEKQKRTYERLESSIDDGLKRGEGYLKIGKGSVPSITEVEKDKIVWARLSKAYEKCGWAVECEIDGSPSIGPGDNYMYIIIKPAAQLNGYTGV